MHDPVPGKHDAGNPVTSDLRRALARLLPSRTAAGATTGPTTETDAPRPARRPRRTAVVLTATLLALGGGSLAFASAHKSVTVDVDGELREVTTFAGSVDGLLAELDLDLGARDVVAPSGDAALRDGDDVVVRHARQVAVLTDGEESRVWTTATDVGEALAALEARGDDVRLVASRSAADGRARLAADNLPLEGPVQVVVDGTTLEVADGSDGLAAVLAEAGVTVGELDRVHVHRPDTAEGVPGPVTVTVQRVVAEQVATEHEIPFETVEQPTDDLYRGQTKVTTKGSAGVRTVVERVVTVDGTVESRMVVSDGVTTQPVTQVVAVGTAERPAPAPRTSSSSSSSGSSGGGSTVSGDVWAALAQCESGGNPKAVSSNGKYYGLYQFSLSTWQSVGGSGKPTDASAQEQTERAQALQARSGWGQWPHCSSKLGLR